MDPLPVQLVMKPARRADAFSKTEEQEESTQYVALLAAVGLAITFMIAGTQALAGAYGFGFVNRSSFTISVFQVRNRASWGENLISSNPDESVAPNASGNLGFLHDGPCKVQIRFGWRAAGGDPKYSSAIDLDACEVNHIYFDGAKFTQD